MENLERITFDTQILGGKACIRGMRVSVALVVKLIADGMSSSEILDEYPDLEKEDLRQALLYASRIVNEEVHPIALEPA